jgi:hypothetical protein
MNIPDDPNVYVLAVAVIATLGASISTLEWINNRQQLKDDGLYSWQVLGSRNITVGSRPLARILNRLLAFRPFVAVLCLRLVFLLSLPVALWFGHRSTIILAAIIIITFLLNLRSPLGMDGSDQMTTQVFGALFLGQLAGTPLAIKASLWFIAGQTSLSYFTSGLAKVLSPFWRDGKVVFDIFNTRTYGYEPMARLLFHQPKMTRVLSWGAVTMETIFPLALVASFPGCLVFVAWGVAFHLMNAVVMGLNSFFWSFVATYPAVIYCAIILGRFLYS